MKRSIFLIALIVGLSMCGSALADDNATFEFKPYGFFKLDGSYDQNLTSHGNFVMWVEQPDPERVGDDEQFNMTARETRLGLQMQSQDNYVADVFAQIEFDLYGKVAGGQIEENTAMLMLRHAYFSVQKGSFKLVAGQTWDLISPLNAPSLNYPVLWGCGNIGYRRPQVSLWVNPIHNDNTTVTLAGGFFRTIGNDLTPSFTIALSDEFADGADDGTDAGIPSFQGLLDLKYNSEGGLWLRAGVSGLWGQLKAETNKGNYVEYESWGVVGHFDFSWDNQFGLLGEAYSGQNLGSYFGGITNNSTIAGLESFGGWGSLWFKPVQKLKVAGGYGYDDPKNEDMLSGRSLNSCAYGNIQYSLVSNVTLGLEVSRWETEYLALDNSTEKFDNLRVQTSFKLSY